MQIAVRIKKIREYRNYTQAYVAKKLGIKQNTYSRIENGVSIIKPARLEKIASILDVKIEFILNEDIPVLNTGDIKKTSNRDAFLIEKMENMIKVLENEIHSLRNKTQGIYI